MEIDFQTLTAVTSERFQSQKGICDMKIPFSVSSHGELKHYSSLMGCGPSQLQLPLSVIRLKEVL